MAEIWHTASPICHTFRRTVIAVATDPRQQLGRSGEELAAEHLTRRGYAILERNYRTRWGELDIVALDPVSRTVVFVEVKTRRAVDGRRPAPLESVHPRKRWQVRKMAGGWLAERGGPGRLPRVKNLRFDAIGITLDRAGRLVDLVHLEGAF
jgi:putative endonuclease